LPTEVRETRDQRAQRYANLAVQRYEQLEQELLARQRVRPLGLAEQDLLRNTYFSWAAALSEMTRWEEAIQVYTAATNRYQHSPAVLEAYAAIAHAYRRLGRDLESRATIEQARIVLGGLPEEADYDGLTGYDREEWVDRLAWLSEL